MIIMDEMVVNYNSVPFANNIGPKGGKAIGTSLSFNSSLTGLKLSCNYNI